MLGEVSEIHGGGKLVLIINYNILKILPDLICPNINHLENARSCLSYWGWVYVFTAPGCSVFILSPATIPAHQILGLASSSVVSNVKVLRSPEVFQKNWEQK